MTPTVDERETYRGRTVQYSKPPEFRQYSDFATRAESAGWVRANNVYCGCGYSGTAITIGPFDSDEVEPLVICPKCESG